MSAVDQSRGAGLSRPPEILEAPRFLPIRWWAFAGAAISAFWVYVLLRWVNPMPVGDSMSDCLARLLGLSTPGANL